MSLKPGAIIICLIIFLERLISKQLSLIGFTEFGYGSNSMLKRKNELPLVTHILLSRLFSHTTICCTGAGKALCVLTDKNL